jgi:hypothetical protein
MGTPTVREAQKIKLMLSDFSEDSGTCVNLEKSNIFFFNTLLDIQNHIF